MAFWNLVPAGLSGAGYDDQDANNDGNDNAYGNTVCGGEQGPDCESTEHREMKFECSLQVWQMQVAFAIDYIYTVICRRARFATCHRSGYSLSPGVDA